MTVTYDSTIISNKNMTATVTKAVNTFYDTATLQSSIPFDAFKNITIDDIFDGFVYSCTRNARAAYTIECRSNTAKLTTPFQSDSVSIIEESTTSHDLCDQYTSDYGYPIVNECENLNFGGGYERTGTVLSAIANIANVTGAEYYPFNGGIKITPNIGIQNISPKVILPSEIHDFIPITSTIENQGIRYIIVGAESVPDMYTTSFRCDVTVEPCDGYTVANIVPADTFSESIGIKLSPVNSRLTYDGVMEPAYTLQLATEIESLTHIFIDGTELLTGFSFVLDTIVFTAEQRGIVYADYIGKQFIGYAPIGYVGQQRYSEFSIIYGNCERYDFQSIMECNDETSYRQCGDSFITTPKVMNYVVGFAMTIFADVAPVFQFYSDEAIYSYTPIPIFTLSTWVDRGILSQDGATWVHTLRFTPDSVNEIRSAGTTIAPASYSIIGDTIVFDSFFFDVVISYQTASLNYFIQYENQIDKNVRMLVGGCEYSLEGLDYDRTDSTVCAEGIVIPIDIVKEIGATYFAASTQIIAVSHSDPIAVPDFTIVTDTFGIARIPNSVYGTYTMNTGNIIKHSSITVEVGAA